MFIRKVQYLKKRVKLLIEKKSLPVYFTYRL